MSELRYRGWIVEAHDRRKTDVLAGIALRHLGNQHLVCEPLDARLAHPRFRVRPDDLADDLLVVEPNHRASTCPRRLGFPSHNGEIPWLVQPPCGGIGGIGIALCHGHIDEMVTGLTASRSTTFCVTSV